MAADGPTRRALALNAGTDSEMVSTGIRDFGQQLLASGDISMASVDDAVRRILRVKFRAGLFDHPYVDVAKAQDPAASSPRPTARPPATAAAKSMVLLKNEDDAAAARPDASRPR